MTTNPVSLFRVVIKVSSFSHMASMRFTLSKPHRLQMILQPTDVNSQALHLIPVQPPSFFTPVLPLPPLVCVIVIEGELRPVLAAWPAQSRGRRCRSHASRTRVQGSHSPEVEVLLPIYRPPPKRNNQVEPTAG